MSAELVNQYNAALDGRVELDEAITAEYVKQFKDALGDRVVIDETIPCQQPSIGHLYCSITEDTSKTHQTLIEQIKDNADWIVETINERCNTKRPRIARITAVRSSDSELKFKVHYCVDYPPVQAAAQAPACPADDKALKRRGLCMEVIGLAQEKLERSMVMAALEAVKSDEVLYLHACFAIGVLNGLSESPHTSVCMKDLYKTKIRQFSFMFE